LRDKRSRDYGAKSNEKENQMNAILNSFVSFFEENNKTKDSNKNIL